MPPAASGVERAEQVYHDTLALQGSSHPDTLDALSDVARQQRAAGDLLAAKATQERVVRARSEIWGDGDYGTFRAKHLLASYVSESGELDEAQQLQEALLDEASRYFEDDAEVMFPAVLNLANTLYSKGEYERAADLYERSTALSTVVNGPNDQVTIDVMAGWILCLREVGCQDEAKKVEKDRSRRDAKRITRNLQSRLRRKGI